MLVTSLELPRCLFVEKAITDDEKKIIKSHKNAELATILN